MLVQEDRMEEEQRKGQGSTLRRASDVASDASDDPTLAGRLWPLRRTLSARRVGRDAGTVQPAGKGAPDAGASDDPSSDAPDEQIGALGGYV